MMKPDLMKIRHVETVFLGYHDPFFFLSRKAAKPQRKTAKRRCGFAALRETCRFHWNNNGIAVFSQRQPIFINPDEA
jgi:hypothetical protein